jgi:hypothetical protein
VQVVVIQQQHVEISKFILLQDLEHLLYLVQEILLAQAR